VALVGKILHCVLDGRDLCNLFAVVIAEDAATVTLRLLGNLSEPSEETTGPVEFGLERPDVSAPADDDDDEVQVARKAPLPWAPGAVVAEVEPEPRWRFRIWDGKPHPYRST
jgi:hypothetical protein